MYAKFDIFFYVIQVTCNMMFSNFDSLSYYLGFFYFYFFNIVICLLTLPKFKFFFQTYILNFFPNTSSPKIKWKYNLKKYPNIETLLVAISRKRKKCKHTNLKLKKQLWFFRPTKILESILLLSEKIIIFWNVSYDIKSNKEKMTTNLRDIGNFNLSSWNSNNLPTLFVQRVLLLHIFCKN